MEYFEDIHVSLDEQHSIVLFKIHELVDQVNQSKLKGYMLLTQVSPKGEKTESITLWFLPNVKGYATACDHAIAARKAIWGDDAP